MPYKNTANQSTEKRPQKSRLQHERLVPAKRTPGAATERLTKAVKLTHCVVWSVKVLLMLGDA